MEPFLAYWVHQWSPFMGPHWGNIGIRYYGLAYVLGFVTAAWLLIRYARAGRSQLAPGLVADFMMAIIFGVMLGGRIGSFVFYKPQELLADPLSLFRIWEGGMASHGGFIGVAVAMAWFSRSRRIPFLHLADLICSAAPAGLLFGRIANFINGELWGKISDVPWAVIFPQSARPGTPLHLILPRHPSQLYEAALEGVVLLGFMQWRFWCSEWVARRPGRLAGEFLVAYAILRMIGEVFREPDATLILGLSRGSFYSLFLLVAAVPLLWPRRAAPSA